MRIFESYFKSVFTNEVLASAYIQILYTYATLVAQVIFSELLNSHEDVLIALIVGLPLGWRLGQNMYEISLQKVKIDIFYKNILIWIDIFKQQAIITKRHYFEN